MTAACYNIAYDGGGGRLLVEANERRFNANFTEAGSKRGEERRKG